MTRSTTTAATSAPFARRGETAREITSEHISDHMAAFRAAGGVIEVLGNKPMHKAPPPAGSGKKTASPAR